MIEFPELDGTNFGCGADSAMFYIAIYDVFSSIPGGKFSDFFR